MTASLPFAPSGRPVARAVSAVLVVAALAGAAWWTGAAHPRLGMRVSSVTFDADSGRGELELAIVNDGPIDVDLRPTWLEGGRVQAAPASTVVATGEEATVRVPFVVDCSIWRVDDIVVELDARTWTGLHRTVVLRDRDVGETAWC